MPDRAELLRAVAADDTERVRELLRADPALADARDDAGVSALMLSRYRWRMDMVGVLRDARESRGALDVFEAAALGDTTRIDELTARDAAVIGRLSPDGFSLLHLACFFGSEDTVRLLLERGADPSVVSTNTMSNQPLHSAASVKRHAVCAMLLAAGADVNALQHGGWTPPPR